MIVLRISRPSFNEIALLLASSGCHAMLKAERQVTLENGRKIEDGEIVRIDLKDLRLEPSV